jgi:PadR family transcriptional regulator AphA
MSPPREGSANAPRSLAGYAVLGLVAEGTTHGFAVARFLTPEADVGRVYVVARPAVYREIELLAVAGLVQELTSQRSSCGPRRTPLRITSMGRRLLDEWLWRPVEHVRDLRTEFLVKLVLIERAGLDPAGLIAAQADRLSPVLAGLKAKYAQAQGFDQAVALWRVKSAEAALEFLADLRVERATATTMR